MKKYIFLSLICIFITFFVCQKSFSDQVATTKDGRQVILKNDGTWAYLLDEDQRREVVKINIDVKRALKPLIMRRDKVFQKNFDLEIEWNSNNPFELSYRSIMEGLYYSAIRQSKMDFTKKAEKAFGPKTAKNLVYLIENWALWRDVVSK